MSISSLERGTRRAIVEETIFSPRNAIIIALILLAAFILPNIFWFVFGAGVALLLGSMALLAFSPKIRDKAINFSFSQGLRPEDLRELTNEEIVSILNGFTMSLKGKVSPEILERVESIRHSIVEILPFIANINSSDHDIFIVRQAALEYLPDTLKNYLQLPRRHAQEVVVSNGKTAHQILLEQLEMLDAELKETIEDLYKNDSQALLAHGRFLKEKFGESELSL